MKTGRQRQERDRSGTQRGMRQGKDVDPKVLAVHEAYRKRSKLKPFRATKLRSDTPELKRLRTQLKRRGMLDFSFMRIADTEGNNRLSIGEVSTGLSSVGLHFDQRELRCLFDAIDEDGSGRISFDELKAALQQTSLDGDVVHDSDGDDGRDCRVLTGSTEEATIEYLENAEAQGLQESAQHGSAAHLNEALEPVVDGSGLCTQLHTQDSDSSSYAAIRDGNLSSFQFLRRLSPTFDWNSYIQHGEDRMLPNLSAQKCIY